MKDLLAEIELDALLLTEEELRQQAATLIKVAFADIETKKEDLKEKGMADSEQFHKLMSTILGYIEEGVKVLNERSETIVIYLENNKDDPKKITFLFKKKPPS